MFIPLAVSIISSSFPHVHMMQSCLLPKPLLNLKFTLHVKYSLIFLQYNALCPRSGIQASLNGGKTEAICSQAVTLFPDYLLLSF
jgi:hypothetical protein